MVQTSNNISESFAELNNNIAKLSEQELSQEIKSDINNGLNNITDNFGNINNEINSLNSRLNEVQEAISNAFSQLQNNYDDIANQNISQELKNDLNSGLANISNEFQKFEQDINFSNSRLNELKDYLESFAEQTKDNINNIINNHNPEELKNLLNSLNCKLTQDVEHFKNEIENINKKTSNFSDALSDITTKIQRT
ncbi:MAG: hypothetical protein MZU97_01865 [Bacillus subtilis]|nr:hypothetical protein [Bacillus subtilis]